MPTEARGTPGGLTELVVLSGKGGTGKTAVTGALADLAREDIRIAGVTLVDADVDAANLEILLRPHRGKKEEFYGGAVARIDPELCMACGYCQDVCRFDALEFDHVLGTFSVDPMACEGCAACFYQCPEEAVALIPQLAGHWYRSSSPFGTLLHARLRPAQENSGKLVSLVKEKGREAARKDGAPLLMVDGPPGIGCPAIAAVSGADLVLMVSEPTKAGLHDLKRAIQLTRHFEVDAKVVVNKADLYPAGAEAVERSCRKWGVEVVGWIPYDEAVVTSMVQRHPVTEHAPGSPASLALRALWTRVRATLGEVGPDPGSQEILQIDVQIQP